VIPLEVKRRGLRLQIGNSSASRLPGTHIYAIAAMRMTSPGSGHGAHPAGGEEARGLGHGSHSASVGSSAAAAARLAQTGKSSRLLIGLQSRLLRRMSPEVALLPRTVGAFA
jgi:hypothetical protein